MAIANKKTEAYEDLSREILVPVLIEETKVPLVFRRPQVALLAGWNGEMPHQEIDKLIGAVLSILGQPGIEGKEKDIHSYREDIRRKAKTR